MMLNILTSGKKLAGNLDLSCICDSLRLSPYTILPVIARNLHAVGRNENIQSVLENLGVLTLYVFTKKLHETDNSLKEGRNPRFNIVIYI